MLGTSVCPHLRSFAARLPTGNLSRNLSSIRSLQDSFRDPSSPFYLAPNARGPASPEDPDPGLHAAIDERQVAAEAKAKLTALGYDPTCFWEQKIVWGDHDSFQHVNNTRYVRFIESGRIEYMAALGRVIGGPAKAEAMTKGRGISLILKSIFVDFKRPVTYPDTLLIGHKPYLPSDVTKPKYHLHCIAVAYSYAQRAIVAESDSICVWYDYDNLKKCYPGEEVWDVVLRGMNREKLEE